MEEHLKLPYGTGIPRTITSNCPVEEKITSNFHVENEDYFQLPCFWGKLIPVLGRLHTSIVLWNWESTLYCLMDVEHYFQLPFKKGTLIPITL